MGAMTKGFSKLTVRALPGLFLLTALAGACIPEPMQEDETEGPADGGAKPEVVIPPIDASAPTDTETATFALGCFWGPDSLFGSLEGVVRTRVGYAGGTTVNPTYHNLGDHTETVQMDYDPAAISYEELLELFWDSHDPAAPSWSRQYMSLLFYHNDEQRSLAVASKERQEAELGRPVLTLLVPFSEFYLAEDYHQKYRLRQEEDLMREFNAFYAEAQDFIDSTAAARINGYLAGHGTFEALREHLDSFGLSPDGEARLLELGRRVLPG